MSRFWVRFYVEGSDPRPLAVPLPPEFLGWWCTGYDAEDNAIVCALVEAEEEADARLLAEDRFAATRVDVDPRPDDWTPPADRFPP